MAFPLIALAAAGGALQAYGTYTSAKSQAAAMRFQAQLDLKRATEVIERDQINRELLFKDAKRHVGEQQAQFASSGRAQDVTTLAMMEEVANLASEQAIRNTRAAQWEASMIKIGAYSKIAGADDVAKAGAISAIGGLVATGAKTAYSSPGFSSSGTSGLFDPTPAAGPTTIGESSPSAPSALTMGF